VGRRRGAALPARRAAPRAMRAIARPKERRPGGHSLAASERLRFKNASLVAELDGGLKSLNEDFYEKVTGIDAAQARIVLMMGGHSPSARSGFLRRFPTRTSANPSRRKTSWPRWDASRRLNDGRLCARPAHGAHDAGPFALETHFMPIDVQSKHPGAPSMHTVRLDPSQAFIPGS
jgi:hypothetical protein